MKPNNLETNENNSEYQEDWLTAYLDDELTVEQQQLVEQRLATDPHAQQTLNDLRLIRGLVQQLPAWSGPVAAMLPRLDASSALTTGDSEAPDKFVRLGEFDVSNTDLSNPETQRFDTETRQRKSRPTQGLYSGWFRPLAMAASLLIVVGVGYGLWSGLLSRNEPLAMQVAPTGEAASSELAAADPAQFSLGEDQLGADDAAVEMKLSEFATPAEPMSMESNFAPMSARAVAEASADRTREFEEAMRAVEQHTLPLPKAPGSAADVREPDFAGPVESLQDKALQDQSLQDQALQDQALKSGPPLGSETRQLFVASDGSWTNAMMQLELLNNSMLAPLQADERGANLYSQLAPIGSSQSMAASGRVSAANNNAMVIAQLPEASDGRELFNQLLNDYQLQRVTEIETGVVDSAASKRQVVEPADGERTDPPQLLRKEMQEEEASTPSADVLSVDDLPLPDNVMSYAPGRSRGTSARASSAPSQMLLLFLTRSQAEQIVQQNAVMKESNRAPQYLWITPSVDAEKSQSRNNDRVIMLLNSKL